MSSPWKGNEALTEYTALQNMIEPRKLTLDMDRYEIEKKRLQMEERRHEQEIGIIERKSRLGEQRIYLEEQRLRVDEEGKSMPGMKLKRPWRSTRS